MTIKQPNVVDFLAWSDSETECMLVVSDHLDWNDYASHPESLRQKLNTYDAFISNGELTRKYPKAAAATVAIEVFCAHPPTPVWLALFENIRAAFAQDGITFRWRYHPQQSEPA